MPSNAILLQQAGTVVYNEDGAAGEAGILPGMLVKGVSSILKFATAGGPAARRFAAERDEMGKEIDVPYAVGDTVKVISLKPGDVVNALIASGQNIAADAWLEPAGDGTLRIYAAGTRIGRATEAVNATAGSARIAVEIY
jgi:hypothetical protein